MRLHASIHAPGPQLLGPLLSVEEQAILEDEHNETAANVDNAAGDLDRVADTNAVQTDVADVVESTETITSVEQDLINSVNDMAVAGTDAEPEVSVAAPDPETGAIATESIVDKAVAGLKKLWAAIEAGLKNLLAGMKHWITSFFSKLDGQTRRVTALRAAVAPFKKSDVEIDTSVEILDVLGYAGTSNYAFARWGGTFEKSINNLNELPKFIFKHQDVMKGLGKGLEALFSAAYKGGESDNNEAINGLVSRVYDVMGDYLKQFGEPHDTSAKDGGYIEFAIGSTSVVAKNPLAADSPDASAQIANMSRLRFDVRKAGMDIETQITVTTPLKGKISELANSIDAKLAALEQLGRSMMHLRDSSIKEMEKLVTSVESSCSQMVDRAEKSDAGNGALAKRFTQLMPAYANWATNPASKLCQEAARHMNFWATLNEKAFNTFQQHGGKQKRESAEDPNKGAAPANAPKVAA